MPSLISVKLFILERYHVLTCANHHEICKLLRKVLQIGAVKPNSRG
jgi:hypothetical protein